MSAELGKREASAPTPSEAFAQARSGSSVSGFLFVDKPGGLTSFDVIRTLRRVLRVREMGHTGTLDPLATGVLVIAVGGATRWVPWLEGGTKEYEARVRFGVTTTTLDADGDVRLRRPVPPLTHETLAEASAGFLGAIEQVPPAWSAIHVNGERAHERARRGESVALAPRSVEIIQIEWTGGAGDAWTLRTCVSRGTYVRALVRDIGEALGCGAHVESLRRTRDGAVCVSDCAPLPESDSRSSADGVARRLRSANECLSHLPAAVLDCLEAERLGHGQRLALPRERLPWGAGCSVRVLGPDNGLLGVGVVREGYAGPVLAPARLAR